MESIGDVGIRQSLFMNGCHDNISVHFTVATVITISVLLNSLTAWQTAEHRPDMIPSLERSFTIPMFV